VPLHALTPSDLDAWAALAARAVEPNPFFEPEFVTAAANSPRAQSPQLLVIEDGGEWIACMPVGAIGPLGIRTWRHPYSYVGTPLVDPAAVGAFAAALVAPLGSWRRGRVLTVLWEAVDQTITAAVREAAAASGNAEVIFERVSERAALERSRQPDGHLAHLKPKRRRELERKREQLTAELGSELAVKTYAGTAAVVDRFLRLEAAGWKGAAGTAMATAGDSEVLRSICSGFSRQGRLQILALEARDQTLAMQCNLSSGDTLFCFRVAYDERYRRFAPGIQLEVDSMRLFQGERTEKVLDTCATPDNQFLNRLWPDRRRSTIMVVGPSGALGTAGSRLLEAAYRYRSKRRAE
jgi:CelD/BcsL family acetyltransferase involved in cellulose biosynthesis